MDMRNMLQSVDSGDSTMLKLACGLIFNDDIICQKAVMR